MSRPRASALLGHEGNHEDIYSGTRPRGRESGHHGQQCTTGSDHTDLNPAAGDWAVPQKAATALDRYGHADEVAALVAFVAGP